MAVFESSRGESRHGSLRHYSCPTFGSSSGSGSHVHGQLQISVPSAVCPARSHRLAIELQNNPVWFGHRSPALLSLRQSSVDVCLLHSHTTPAASQPFDLSSTFPEAAIDWSRSRVSPRVESVAHAAVASNTPRP